MSEKLKHDIRNFKILNEKQLNCAFELSSKEKNDILKLYNDMFKYINEIFLSDNEELIQNNKSKK